MILFRGVALLGFLVLLAAPARAGDPRPPALNTSVLAEPAPIVQEGSTRLAYEMLITNFSKLTYVLDSVSASAGDAQFEFGGNALAAMVTHLGAASQPGTAGARAIEAGRSVIVFFLLDLGAGKTATTIANTLHVLDGDGGRHDVTLAPLPVSQDKPIVVAPPLRGDWIAGDSLNNGTGAAHRRAVLIDNGRAWLAQRYAIDWVQVRKVGAAMATWQGAEDKNSSYFCYDQPIYNVAPGKVVEASDGLPENVPHSGKYAVPIDFNNAAGNHVVVEIGPHRYVLYAHMRPGTVRVKPGDRVSSGEIIGRVGNTGSSTEPHLHMHIDDQPSFLAGNGVPYEFTRGEESGPVEANVSSPVAIKLGPIGPQRPFTNDYPAENALVTFK